jgi:hypothetical protein
MIDGMAARVSTCLAMSLAEQGSAMVVGSDSGRRRRRHARGATLLDRNSMDRSRFFYGVLIGSAVVGLVLLAL